MVSLGTHTSLLVCSIELIFSHLLKDRLDLDLNYWFLQLFIRTKVTMETGYLKAACRHMNANKFSIIYIKHHNGTNILGRFHIDITFNKREKCT